MLQGLTLEPEFARQFEERFHTRLCTSYGLSEGLPSVFASSPVEERRWGSAGRPRRGITAWVVDGDGHQLGPHEEGSLILRGQQPHDLTLGYYRDPVQTAETYRNGELLTGDRGYFDADGFFYYTGRSKDMIKRSGFNVAAAEAERVIDEIPGVQEPAVVGTPDLVREEAIVAYVVVTGSPQVTQEQVVEACRLALADYKVPQFVKFVPDLPRTFLTKLDRKMLREWALEFRIDTADRRPLGGPHNSSSKGGVAQE